jgi:hypothetical protein
MYIFLMNGLDPLNYANLTGLRDYLHDQGSIKSYYGQLYHYWWFTSEIRKLAREDPDGRFILVGFSLGANVVHAVAEAVKPDGIHIDLLVFLSSNHPLKRMPKEAPENVGRTVNILTGGLMGSLGELGYAENVRLSRTLHFGSPTHPTTLQTLSQELRAVSARGIVPLPHETPRPPISSEASALRPVTTH